MVSALFFRVAEWNETFKLLFISELHDTICAERSPHPTKERDNVNCFEFHWASQSKGEIRWYSDKTESMYAIDLTFEADLMI